MFQNSIGQSLYSIIQGCLPKIGKSRIGLQRKYSRAWSNSNDVAGSRFPPVVFVLNDHRAELKQLVTSRSTPFSLLRVLNSEAIITRGVLWKFQKKLIDCLNKSEISFEILHHPAAFTAAVSWTADR